MYELIRAHEDYLRHLEDGGEPVDLGLPANGSRRPGETRVRASMLGMCPVYSALVRAGEPPSNPELAMTYAKLMLFNEGNYCGRLWQAAMTFGEDTYGWRASHEVEVGDERMVGSIDTLLELSDGRRVVVEYKRTDLRSPNPPRLYQIAAYMILANVQRGFLVYQARFDARVFEVSQYDDEFWLLEPGGQPARVFNTQTIYSLAEVHNETFAKLGESVFSGWDVDSVLPGECVEEKSSDDLYPKEAKGTAKDGRYRKGDLLPGTITPKCQYFTKCFCRDGRQYRTDFGEAGELVWR